MEISERVRVELEKVEVTQQMYQLLRPRNGRVRLCLDLRYVFTSPAYGGNLACNVISTLRRGGFTVVSTCHPDWRDLWLQLLQGEAMEVSWDG